jgi:DNA-binding transcriptional MerR regulator
MSNSHENPLSIGEVVKATGVGEATLRAWERRFGFPQPRREPSGHRRYSSEQVEQIHRVLRERERGIELPVAIERAAAVADEGPSLFAHLRKHRPEQLPMIVSKPHMVRLSRAIEDESAARAERPLLIGSFQHERYYRQSQPRWEELAHGAEAALVFADFERPRRPAGAPAEIPIDQTHPLAREWSLICLAPGHCACLIGWEPPPGGLPTGGPGRQFEVLFSVEPAVVRESGVAAAAIMAALDPELAASTRRHLERLVDPPAESQLRLSSAITARLLAALR